MWSDCDCGGGGGRDTTPQSGGLVENVDTRPRGKGKGSHIIGSCLTSKFIHTILYLNLLGLRTDGINRML